MLFFVCIYCNALLICATGFNGREDLNFRISVTYSHVLHLEEIPAVDFDDN
jgi:hypothetical protein